MWVQSGFAIHRECKLGSDCFAKDEKAVLSEDGDDIRIIRGGIISIP